MGLEGNEGLQERCLPLAEGVGRESGQLAPPGSWRPAHHIEQGAGRLHWSEGDRALQGRYLPLLSLQHHDALLFAAMTSLFFCLRVSWGLLDTAACCPTDSRQHGSCGLDAK